MTPAPAINLLLVPHIQAGLHHHPCSSGPWFVVVQVVGLWTGEASLLWPAVVSPGCRLLLRPTPSPPMAGAARVSCCGRQSDRAGGFARLAGRYPSSALQELPRHHSSHAIDASPCRLQIQPFQDTTSKPVQSSNAVVAKKNEDCSNSSDTGSDSDSEEVFWIPLL